MALPDSQLYLRVNDFLLEEADCLDQRRWRDWLDLYDENAVFWAPAWDDDHVLTSDPKSEISLIYSDNRSSLEDRIWRIESGLSSSLIRLPRTCHLVNNVRIPDGGPDPIRVTANFRTETFKHEEQRSDAFFGRYEYELKPVAEGFKIQRKKITIYNDIIPRQLDIFNV